MHELDPWDLKGEIEIRPYAKLIDSSGKTVRELLIPYFPGNNDFTPLSLTENWKEVEEIHIIVDIDYNIMVATTFHPFKAQGAGSYRLDQGWRVVYGDNGLVLEPKPYKNVVPASGSGDFAFAVDLLTDQNPRENGPTYASLLLRLRGGETDDGITLGVTAGPATIGGAFAKSSASYVEDYELKLNINVNGKPGKQPEPIILPADMLKEVVYFDEPIKAGNTPGEDQPNLSAAELRRLEDTWIRPLQSRAPELYDVIKSGDCPLTLMGYASDTGNVQYDFAISQKRITSVTEALKNLIGSERLKINRVPLGHYAARQTGAVAREKRVEILIDPQAAQQKIAAKRKK
jgi:hypothetical protein